MEKGKHKTSPTHAQTAKADACVTRLSKDTAFPNHYQLGLPLFDNLTYCTNRS
jgi:hypothetical protein